VLQFPIPLVDLPLIDVVGTLYSQHTQLADGAICAAVALATFLFTFVALPAIDLVLGKDLRYQTQEELKAAAGDQGYRAMLWTFALAHCGLLAACCSTVHDYHIHPLAMLGLALSMGTHGAYAFTTAHELVHGKSALDRSMANLLLCSVCYMHWANSHRAHHIKVATPADPASARLGESVYRFVPRSIAGNLRDGIDMELARLKAKGHSIYSIHNRMLSWVLAPMLTMGGIAWEWGPEGLGLFIVQAVVSVAWLEIVNYVEHYGLQRKQLPNGRFERVTDMHSWEANWMFTSSCIWRLQRHADHHLNSSKPYQVLDDIESSPQLPMCYPAMALLAIVPAAWFWVMNPRAIAAQTANTK
jgi:alkane 1-monooxygenase